jgi:hypothetical protein
MNLSPSMYPSKIDLWLAALLIGAPLFVIGFGIYLTITSGPSGMIGIYIGLFMGCVMAALSLPCRYSLTDSALIIQCGLLKEEIRYEKIKNASLSSNPLSAPALSLSRVKVDLENGFRLISPINREAFITELENKRKKQG